MYDSTRSAFVGFTTPLEGCIPYMYLDIKGLATIGIGNLIDPVSMALPLPFVRKPDSSPASQSEITAEWNTVKAMTSLATQGAKAAASVTTLMLTQDSITSLVLAKLDSNAATLKATPAFSSFETWPADAQLGLLSMAWALGSAFAAGWPVFTAAVGRGDWAAAAANCQISTAGNPGVAPRNTADVQLFTNAAVVAAAAPACSGTRGRHRRALPAAAPGRAPTAVMAVAGMPRHRTAGRPTALATLPTAPVPERTGPPIKITEAACRIPYRRIRAQETDCRIEKGLPGAGPNNTLIN